MKVLLQKPSKIWKAEDHLRYLGERPAKWKEGQLSNLVRKGRAIQSMLPSVRGNPRDAAAMHKQFSWSMLQGKVSAAMNYLEANANSAVLDVTPEVIESLREKHPPAQPMKLEGLLKGLVDDVPVTVYDNITGEDILKSITITRGGARASGLDALGLRRICWSMSNDLCEALSMTTRRLCNSYVDPFFLSPLLSNQLLALDKNPGIRPIGIGECLRRVIGKTVTQKFKSLLTETAGPLQLAAGHLSGSEAAVHEARALFEDNETDCTLLVDAENAFNKLKRQVVLHNLQVLCPIVAKFAINLYRRANRLFTCNNELSGEEGVTQGDPFAMIFYGLSIIPLIYSHGTECRTAWFADDSRGGGNFLTLKLGGISSVLKAQRMGTVQMQRKPTLL